MARVFISYGGPDEAAACAIASFMDINGIAYYLDKLDGELAAASAASDASAVVTTLSKRIASSSHLLAVISNSTKERWWPAWEAGAATALVPPKPLAYMLRESVELLPAFYHVGTKLLDVIDLKTWVRAIPGAPTELRESLAKAASSIRLDSHFPQVRVTQPKVY